VLKGCAQRNVKFLEQYTGIKMAPRSEGHSLWKSLNESLIRSGDFFGVIRLDGLDPVLAWAMGSAAGHVTVAIRDPVDDTLFIAESTVNSSYWPSNGVQRTEYAQWMDQAKNAGFNIVWAPLSDESRRNFDAEAAWDFLMTVEGLDYGFPSMLGAWIDTKEDNYPCLPPDFKRCLTWKVLEVGFGFIERVVPGFGLLVIPGLNKRLNVENLTLSELYYLAFSKGIESEDLMSIVEEDGWKYRQRTNNGSEVEGLSMVCCMFVCHLWKRGGLFERLGSDNVNCNEFVTFDNYALDLFDAEFTANRPEVCKKADPLNPLCQVMGEYSLTLDKWNTIEPHVHMMEHCPSQPPDYQRPAGC